MTLEHEYILIMRKGGKREFKSAEEKLARRESAFFWEERNRWFSDTWDFKGTRQALGRAELRDRSAAFPFELPYRLINMYSVRGDTVFDPFLGTGTTTFAAMACGRSSIGFDIDPSFVAAAATECRTIGNALNLQIWDRLREHLAFVEQCRKTGKELKHTNVPHGFPVMTSQEVDLQMHVIDEIRACGSGRFETVSRPIGKDLSRRVRGTGRPG